MEAADENISLGENEKKALQGLLDAFEDAFSLKEIASAYWQSGRNAELASEILCNSQGSFSISATNSSICEVWGEESSESSFGNSSDNSSHAGHGKVWKQKKFSPSMGTVSGFLGKDYIRSTPLANESSVSTKPLLINLVPVPSTVEDQTNSSSLEDDGSHKDMEDFLFSMLGDGFQLDREAIQEVLGHCGYDMRKSMDELLNLSVLRLERKDEGKSMRKLAGDSDCLQQEALGHNTHGSNGGRNPNRNKKELPKGLKQKHDVEKEILASLFGSLGLEKKQEAPRKSQSKKPKRSLALGQLVEPPRDTGEEEKAPTVYLQQKVNGNDGHDEDNYEELQTVMREYQATMKEYYKAAVDAYADGDYGRAGKLLDQGHFFHKKARDAREESARKIFKVRNGETDIQDTLTLDLHDYGAKEAIRLLKFHISSVSVFRTLKVILDTKGEDSTEGARKRRIMKMLENESIKWVEGEDPGTLLICMDGAGSSK